MKIRNILEYTILLTILATPAAADPVSRTFVGGIAYLEDTGGGVFSGAVVGGLLTLDYTYDTSPSNAEVLCSDTGDFCQWTFAGMPYEGNISDGVTSMHGSKAIIEVLNNDPIQEGDSEVSLFNALLGADIVSENDLTDRWTVATLSDGAFFDEANVLHDGIEFSVVNISLDTSLYADATFQPVPPRVGDVILSFFVIEEADAAGNTLFFAVGLLQPIPIKVSDAGNFNGNNKTDLSVLLRDPNTGKNKVFVMDGGSGKNIRTVSFGTEPARGVTTVPDANGDLIPEYAVLLEGSLFARVKDVVNNTLLGKPGFNKAFDPVAFFSVGDAGGGIGPDVVVVGRDASTGKVQAQVKDVASGKLVRSMNFSKAFVPFDAVAVDNVGGTAAMEIAVLGIDASGKVQAQVKDAQSGKLIRKVQFNKQFTPLFFAAVPNAGGKLKHLAVLGRNASGVIQAQIKRVSDGTLVNKVTFSKGYDPRAFISFADSNGSGGGEIGVVGVNGSGLVRAQVKEIANGTKIANINFSKAYPPLDAIAINSVAGTGRNEIAVLGQKVTGEFRLQIKDLLSGNLVKNIPVP
jgi:hypothetical protein